MSKFDQVKTKEVELPISKAKVIIKNILNFGMTLEMSVFENERDAQLFMVKEMIVSWDFTDEKEQPIPVTIESIKRLSPADGQFIVNQITKFFVDDKKKEETK